MKLLLKISQQKKAENVLKNKNKSNFSFLLEDN